MKAQQIHEGVNYHLEQRIPLHESVYRLGSDEYFNMFVEARKLYNEGRLKNLHWFDEEILRDTQLGEWVNIKGIGRVPLDMIIDEDNHAIAEARYNGEENYIEVAVSSASKALEALADARIAYNTEGSNYYIFPDEQSVYDALELFQQWGVEVENSNLELDEAEYRGKKVSLNKPKRGGSKKFYVYTKNKKGNVIKVAFGAAGGGGNLAVKLRDPKARKAFADRHNCEQKNDKTKAGYWSCRLPRYAKSLGLSGGGTWW